MLWASLVHFTFRVQALATQLQGLELAMELMARQAFPVEVAFSQMKHGSPS
jgi:hypothetical protein